MSLRDRFGRVIALIVVGGAAVVATAVLAGDSSKGRERWTFLDDVALAELGLAPHGTRSGLWRLEEDAEATGGRALANHEGEPGALPAVLVAIEPRSRDAHVKTRCKVVHRVEDAGGLPSGCGVVFRFVDERNHWVARVDAQKQEVDVTTVAFGRETVVRAVPIATGLGRWIDLDVEARGDVIEVGVDGRQVLIAQATTVPAAFGAIGLWASSEATVFFDHFALETLSPAPRALEILPLLGRKSG